jgi:hypothetical protein
VDRSVDPLCRLLTLKASVQMIGGAINDDVDGNEFVHHVTRAAAAAVA